MPRARSGPMLLCSAAIPFSFAIEIGPPVSAESDFCGSWHLISPVSLPSRWEEFRWRYAAKIDEHREEFDRLLDLALKGPITLVYAARDETHNDAVVLREFLLAHR